jgi:Pyruvate/2-oxoacid:ferredoxin oxidoreductase delta subunit
MGCGKRWAPGYDHCKGCGICVAECPSLITMEPEET